MNALLEPHVFVCYVFFFLYILSIRYLGFALRVFVVGFFVRLCASTWMFEWHQIEPKCKRIHTNSGEHRSLVSFVFGFSSSSFFLLVGAYVFELVFHSVERAARIISLSLSHYRLYNWHECACDARQQYGHTWWRRSSSVARWVRTKSFKHTYVFPVVNVFVLALTTTTSTLSSGRNFNSTSLQ